MEPIIQRLKEEDINKIAAGEVIENPASIVKELIENSLDAKAKRIDVVIEKGGHELIQVSDDGLGMGSEDALLSLERHATSKIRTADDLNTLSTKGFRGEALASIAAVSLFEIQTSQDQLGTKVVAKGGEIGKSEPIARNRGTTIFVSSLFFNTPARKKFQKSLSASTSQILKAVETVALAHPDVAFSLTSNKETLLLLDIQERRERVEAVLGPFKETVSAEGVWGLLAAPEEARTQRRGQYFFINNRPVFSPFVSKAVQMGYGTRLSDGLYPPFILFLDLSPHEIDVNVHPQKKEVRFSDEKRVFRLIQRAIDGAFSDLPSAKVPFSFDEPVFRELFPKPMNFESFRDPNSVASCDPALPLEFFERPLFVFEQFLLLEKGALFLVDLERARARILFESLTPQNNGSQSLIWPLEIEADDGEEVSVELVKLGIECRVIGKKRVAIDALPPFLEASDFPLFFSTYSQTKKIESALSIFCRSSQKRVSLSEAHLLWKSLLNCSEKRVDPQGRMIWKEVKKIDFEQVLNV